MMQIDEAGGRDVRNELAPSGRLRLGIVEAPAPSALFAVRDPVNGLHRGVTVDLGRALALDLDVPLELHPFMNSGACTTALESGIIDVTFLPVDDERRRRIAFGPAYYTIQSTYLVAAGSEIESLADVDRKGVRVVGIANTTTIRSSARSLKSTVPVAVESIAEAVERLKSGQADALALSRDAFVTLLPDLPGSRVLKGGFQSTGIAVAVQRWKPAALACVSAFIEDAIRSGLVRRALDKAGFADEPVARRQGY
jgi:polar amino acid transport system substrate-binding protein